MSAYVDDQVVRTVRLYGSLGTLFGRVHRLAVASTAEAVQALCAMIPGFEKELMTSKDRGVGYACFLGKRNLPDDRLHDPAGMEDIRIAPIVQGNKRGGLFQVVLGAAMFFAAPYLAPVFGNVAGALGMDAIGALVATQSIASGLGVSMMLGGVAQLLSPQQRGLSAKDGPDNGASYNFNGPVNTTAQGNCVPLLYGELYIGSATVSAGIFSEDQQ